MSFSSEVKENLSKINNFKEEILKPELIGYFLCGNTIECEGFFEFITENEFNIEHLYKILFQLKVDYEPEMRGKYYIAQISKKTVQNIVKDKEKIQGDNRKNILKGVFLGAGSLNNPEKNYHLEIIFNSEDYADFILEIGKEFSIEFKKIQVKGKFQIYLKEAEEISRFLALIGANLAVLKFEDVRVLKEMKNSVNRKVNCETANLNKTIDAALRQTEEIKLIKKKRKFDKMPKELQMIANLRLENPDLSLKDLGELIDTKMGKSTVNRKFQKIHEIAESLK